MTREVLVVGYDLNRVMELGVVFSGSALTVGMMEAERPLQRLVSARSSSPGGAVVWLTPRDNVADIRHLLRLYPDTRFLMLTREFPPSPAVARVVNAAAGAVMSDDESTVVIVATMVAMLAGSDRETAQASG